MWFVLSGFWKAKLIILPFFKIDSNLKSAGCGGFRRGNCILNEKCILHLFFGTKSTDHPGGEFHGMVLVLVMAHITGIRPTTAGKPAGKQGKSVF